MERTEELAAKVRAEALPLTGSPRDYDRLVEMAKGARFVLLGEASHGTHEFYRERARITRRLVEELGFRAVVVEADWPDAYRVNRFVRGLGPDLEAVEALAGFERFPAWMWRNADVLDFVGWLRSYDDALSLEVPRVGFYGMDLYSLYASIEAVVAYLERVDPEAAGRARERYACLDHSRRDPAEYGRAAAWGLEEPCEEEVVAQLVEMQRRRRELVGGESWGEQDEYFFAEQNARLARDAEAYYRAMFRGSAPSWNLRDGHMADTLDALVAHLDRQQPGARVVVWAHNSHVGDARATELGRGGELTVGQLVRERHPGETLAVGLTTWGGTVTAASDWDEPAERRKVRPALRGSYEALFHRTGLERFLLPLREGGVREALLPERLERAIGVVYRPQTERASHYFAASLPAQFDLVLHFDETRAVEPLERLARWVRSEAPETYPWTI